MGHVPMRPALGVAQNGVTILRESALVGSVFLRDWVKDIQGWWGKLWLVLL